MEVEQRIRRCLLIDKMNTQKDFSKNLGWKIYQNFMVKELWERR